MARLSNSPAVPHIASMLASLFACITIVHLIPTGSPHEFVLIAGLFLISLLPLSLMLYRHSRNRIRTRCFERKQYELFRAAAEGSLKTFALYKPVSNRRGKVTDFRLCYANGSAKRLLGLEVEGGLRRSLKQVLENDGAETITSVFARLYALGRTERLAVSIVGHGNPGSVFDAAVEPVGSCVALRIERREDEVTPEKIVELQEFAQSVIEGAPMSMIATDASGMVIAMNAAAEQLTLYSRTELMGQHSVTLLHDPSELHRRAEEFSREQQSPVMPGFETVVFKSGAPRDKSREWSLIRKDGSRACLNLTVNTLMTPKKRVTGYLCVGFDVTEQKRLTDSVAYMERYDQLTGLANRMLLHERIAHELVQSRMLCRSMAVYVVNIDFFKRVNDSLGHGAGDLVLTHVAAHLSQSLGSQGTVARVGGDEFVVLLPDAGSREEAELRAQRLLSMVSAPVTICGREVRMTASIGMSLYPEDGEEADALLREANLAMYQAKEDGRGCVRVFSKEMWREAADWLEMEEDLRHALQAQEFELYYQAQVSCSTGQVTGMESLLRWNSPKHGNVSPTTFLPILEQAGLLVEIGEWGLRQACLDCRKMEQALGRPLQVAVNLSPMQASQRNLVSVVETALAQAGLPPRHLELEITEDILMASTPRVRESLKELRGLGCHVAIDDFGTGFSSFSYILEYTVDRLKIDRSFVSRLNQDQHANAIVRAIIAMGRGLDIELVAEGVETCEQLEFLRRKHCSCIQGWLFAKATPIAGFASAIEDAEGRARQLMPGTAGGAIRGPAIVRSVRQHA